jgi:hypothetical protein
MSVPECCGQPMTAVPYRQIQPPTGKRQTRLVCASCGTRRWLEGDE